MQENLAEMVRGNETEETAQTQPTTLPTPPVEGAPEDPNAVQTPVDAAEDTVADNTPDITLSSLSEWFDENRTTFTNIRRVRMDIAGINPDKTLLLSVVVSNQEETEGVEPERDIFVFKGADGIPVLDMPGGAMFVYNNGFEVHYNLGEDYALKCYGVKTGLIIVHCWIDDNNLIPFAKTRLKKKDAGLNRLPLDVARMEAVKLVSADTEAIEIQYKQIQKHISDITTNQDAINWLLARQSGVMDINHLLQIDDVIINMMSL